MDLIFVNLKLVNLIKLKIFLNCIEIFCEDRECDVIFEIN